LDISFKDKKTANLFNENAKLEKQHGAQRAKKIRIRLAELRAAPTLNEFGPPKKPPARCHELTGGKRKGQISVDLDHPYRLIFIPNHDPVPRKEDGGLDWEQVTSVKILGVEDTHE
jgi:proteic killer suppression protein